MRVVEGHARGRRVAKVDLRVGHLRQVVPSALAFSFELVAQGSPAEGAELEIKDVEPHGRCRDCGRDGRIAAFPIACLGCGSLDVEVTGGEELLVEALEVVSEATSRGGGEL